MKHRLDLNLYRQRYHAETLSRRHALRHTARIFLALVQLPCARIWLDSIGGTR